MDDQSDGTDEGHAGQRRGRPGDDLVRHLVEHGTDEERAALHALADVLAADLIKRQADELRHLRAQLRER